MFGELYKIIGEVYNSYVIFFVFYRPNIKPVKHLDLLRISVVISLLHLFALSSRADNVDDLVKTAMKKHQIPGISLKVVHDGVEIKSECYGFANLEWNVPVTTDTVFEIGSVSKQFTAACILLLAQDGKLSVNDPISKYLTNTPSAWSNITIRHLLTHTSGVTNYDSLDGFELRQHMTQRQFIEKLGVHPLDFQPGESWHYSNSGFNLLGYIIENVSGQNYWNFLRTRILSPLGMNCTTDREPSTVIPKRATGYEFKNHSAINRGYDLTDLFAAGAIVSTAPDLVKWDAALDGDNLLSAKTKELWWTPVTLKNGKIQNYGFGWFLDPLDGHRNIGHNGATSGFSASNQRFPNDKLTIVLLCNSGELAISTSIAKEVAKIYFADFAKTK